jgi:hypothetical protein
LESFLPLDTAALPDSVVPPYQPLKVTPAKCLKISQADDTGCFELEQWAAWQGVSHKKWNKKSLGCSE